MACTKCTLTNTGSTIVNFSYQRCDDYYWDYQVELTPNQTKNIWFIDGTYMVAQSFLSVIDRTNCISFPPTSATQTPTPTPTPTPTNTLTPTNTATNTPTNTATPTNTSTPTNTVTNTATNTPTPTNTSTPTNTLTPTNTVTITPTLTNTPTTTNTQTPTSTVTQTPSPTTSAQMIINPILIGEDEYLIVGNNEYLQF